MAKVYFIGSILIAFALGGAGMWAYQMHQNRTSIPSAGTSLSPYDLFNNKSGQPASGLFGEMERMRRQMDQFFKQDDFFGNGGTAGNFDSLLNTPDGGPGTKIERGEDDKSVFYKIDVGDKNVSNLQVNVDHGYISIDAQLEDKSNNSYAASSISESFPVPAGVNPNSAKVNKEGDSIVIRFDKVS